MPRIIILIFLALIIYNLAKGFRQIMSEPAESDAGVRSLTKRIALSFLLLGLIGLGIVTGYIQPHDVLPPK